MTSKSRKSLLLIALGCIFAGVMSYFIWLFLAPTAATVPNTGEPAARIEVQTDVIKSNVFLKLQPYAVLPIVPSNVGRANPFLPLPAPEKKTEAEANVQPAETQGQGANGG